LLDQLVNESPEADRLATQRPNLPILRQLPPKLSSFNALCPIGFALARVFSLILRVAKISFIGVQ
jgi:hypothetical protein